MFNSVLTVTIKLLYNYFIVPVQCLPSHQDTPLSFFCFFTGSFIMDITGQTTVNHQYSQPWENSISLICRTVFNRLCCSNLRAFYLTQMIYRLKNGINFNHVFLLPYLSVFTVRLCCQLGPNQLTVFFFTFIATPDKSKSHWTTRGTGNIVQYSSP